MSWTIFLNLFSLIKLKNSASNDSGAVVVKYSEVEKFLEKRSGVDLSDDVVEVVDDNEWLIWFIIFSI